jgi:hypothetical protein
MAEIAKPVGTCGHTHQLWLSPLGQRDLTIAVWRVVAPVNARHPSNDGDYQLIPLSPGTLLRHDQSDWALQGCAAAEDTYVWERFAVLNGPLAGQCVEFGIIAPRKNQTAMPPQVQPA